MDERLKAERDRVYQRNGVPVPGDDAVSRVKALLANDLGDAVVVPKVDLAEIVRNIGSAWLYGAWKARAEAAEAELARLRSTTEMVSDKRVGEALDRSRTP